MKTNIFIHTFENSEEVKSNLRNLRGQQPPAGSNLPVDLVRVARKARIQELVFDDLAATCPAAYRQALNAMAYAAELLKD